MVYWHLLFPKEIYTCQLPFCPFLKLCVYKEYLIVIFLPPFTLRYPRRCLWVPLYSLLKQPHIGNCHHGVRSLITQYYPLWLQATIQGPWKELSQSPSQVSFNWRCQRQNMRFSACSAGALLMSCNLPLNLEFSQVFFCFCFVGSHHSPIGTDPLSNCQTPSDVKWVTDSDMVEIT